MQKKLLQTLAFATMFTANVGVLTDAHAGLEDDYMTCVTKLSSHPVGDCDSDLTSAKLKANILREAGDGTYDMDVGCADCNAALTALRDSWLSFGETMDISKSNVSIMYCNSLKKLAATYM